MAGFKIILTARADADVTRLEAFIANESPRNAARALERLNRGISLLSEFPEMGFAVGRGHRQLILRYGKSGYVVRYRVSGDTAILARLWQGRANRSGAP